MNKKEFMSKLKKEIKTLPDEEQQRIISYYEEYLEEASEKEISDLESPLEIATTLKKEYGEKKEKSKETNNKLPIYIILGIFASPFLLMFGCVLFAILIFIWSIIFALGMSAFAFGLVAIILFIMSLCTIPMSFATSLFICGVSLLCAVVSLLLCKFTWFVSLKTVEAVSLIIGKILKRGEQK